MKIRASHLLIIAAVGVAAAVWLLRPAEKPLEVAVVKAARGPIEKTVVNTRAGTLESCRRARMAPATGGQVARRLVEVGDRVAAGQLLMTLWNADVSAEITLANSERKALEAQVLETCLMSEVAQREADRLNALKGRGLAAEEQVDRAVTNASASRASCTAAKARLAVGDARIALAKAMFDKTELRAPFDGSIAAINAEEGEFVTPSPPGIATLPAIDLVDTRCFRVKVPVDEVDAPLIREGMRARIRLDAYVGQEFNATLVRIAPYVVDIEKQARTVEVEVGFDDPDEFRGLLAGYSADAEVIVDQKDDVLRIPTSAIAGDKTVWVVKEGQLAKRDVTPGISHWRLTEIAEGLQAGESVAVAVDDAVFIEGLAVTPVEESY